MQTAAGSESATKNRTVVERTSERELVIRRSFNAPAHIVFDAWTKPELMKQWWAPRALGVKLFSVEADLRVGGAFRYVFGHEEAKAMAFSGVYKEFSPPTRVVATQVFEPMRHEGEAIVTITFDEKDGVTHVVLHQLFPSKKALDGAVESGMERGMRNTFDQLEALVATLRS